MIGDTIFAVSTAPGRAGIAVVRVSGPSAAMAIERLAPPLPKPRFAGFRRIRDMGGEEIDQGLVLWFKGPATETGEDMAEFHLHGSRAVTEALLEALCGLKDFRPAGPGEFTRRAFDNGKLDLTAVEGLADLIEAETASQRRQALSQLDGALGRLCEDWRRRLVEGLALVEAGIDFADEDDVPADIWRTARPALEALAAEIAGHLADNRRGERIRDGMTLVIAGPPNAGKSSLLNALARRDVAIVAASPGTTRDVIEVRLDLGGLAVTAIDTAGLREAADAIEAEGIRRAEARIARADLVLWVEAMDAAEAGLTPAAGVPVLRVWNKCDLAHGMTSVVPGDDEFAVSALTGAGLDGLLDAVAARLRADGPTGAAPVITRARHRNELMAAEQALGRALAGDCVTAPDRVAEDLRMAASALGRIIGRIDVEDILDVVFRDFCIGK